MVFLKEVELFFLKLPLKNPFETSFGVQIYNESILLKLSTISGSIGWGEIPLTSDPGYCYETVSTAYHILKDYIFPNVKQANIDNLLSNIDDCINLYPKLIADIRGHQFAKSGLDFCFWNLKSEIENISLPTLLGATKDKIQVGISIGIQKTIEELVVKVQNALEQNYARIKIKIGPENDIINIRELRKELGDFPLMVDANSAYSLDDIEILKKLDKYDLLMVEQPLGYDDIVDHSFLQKELSTPICLDESIHSVEDVKKARSLDACKIINLKPSRVGGLLESLKIVNYCHENLLGLWCGGMLESGVGRIVNVSIQANEKFTFPGDTSPSQRFYREDIIKPEVLMDNDGTINVFQKYDILENEIIKYSKKRVKIELNQ